LPAICLSNIFADQIAENYSYRKAINLLADGKTLVVAGGIGRPYFTHDTAAVNLALELDCQVVLKATKVNGVYNRDPVKFPDAQMIPRLSFKQAVEDSSIAVMDKSALGLAMDHSLPIIVFDAMQSDAILKISRGEDVGTRIDV
jgi:uridylate kinase